MSMAARAALPSRLWAPLIAVGSVASTIALVLFITQGTTPGLVIDAVLLWAVLARKWRPTPLIGRRAQSNRPVTS
jgi:hypothetical protein